MWFARPARRRRMCASGWGRPARIWAAWGGAGSPMPRFASLMMLFTMANCGLPATSGFVGEFMGILGGVRYDFWIGLAAATTLGVGGGGLLWGCKPGVLGAVCNLCRRGWGAAPPRAMVGAELSCWDLLDGHAVQYAFGGMFVSDPMAQVLKLFACLATGFALVYAQSYARSRAMWRGELFSLALFTLLGVMTMISANN